MEKLQYLGRFIGVLVGLLLIGVGVYYAITLFTQIYTGVTEPETVSKTLDEWALFIAADLKGYEHNALLNKVEHLRIMALIVVGLGGLMLTWLTIHLIVGGSKVLQIATAFPPAARPVAAPAAVPQPQTQPRQRKEPAYSPIPPRQSKAPQEREAPPLRPKAPVSS